MHDAALPGQPLRSGICRSQQLPPTLCMRLCRLIHVSTGHRLLLLPPPLLLILLRHVLLRRGRGEGRNECAAGARWNVRGLCRWRVQEPGSRMHASEHVHPECNLRGDENRAQPVPPHHLAGCGALEHLQRIALQLHLLSRGQHLQCARRWAGGMRWAANLARGGEAPAPGAAAAAPRPTHQPVPSAQAHRPPHDGALADERLPRAGVAADEHHCITRGVQGGRRRRWGKQYRASGIPRSGPRRRGAGGAGGGPGAPAGRVRATGARGRDGVPAAPRSRLLRRPTTELRPGSGPGARRGGAPVRAS